jgi:hypothetical protein
MIVVSRFKPNEKYASEICGRNYQRQLQVQFQP